MDIFQFSLYSKSTQASSTVYRFYVELQLKRKNCRIFLAIFSKTRNKTGNPRTQCIDWALYKTSSTLLLQVVGGTEFCYQEWRQCWGFHCEWNSLKTLPIPQLVSTHLAPPSSRSRLQQFDIQWTGPLQSPVGSFKLFCF